MRGWKAQKFDLAVLVAWQTFRKIVLKSELRLSLTALAKGFGPINIPGATGV